MQIEDVEIPEYVKVSEPGLLEGEDPSLYWKMFAKLVKERSPELISDWIAINDVATKLWRSVFIGVLPMQSFRQANYLPCSK